MKSVAERNRLYNNKNYPYDPFDGDRLAHVNIFTENIARIHEEYEPAVQVWLKEMEDQKIVYTFYSREDLESYYNKVLQKIRSQQARKIKK